MLSSATRRWSGSTESIGEGATIEAVVLNKAAAPSSGGGGQGHRHHHEDTRWAIADAKPALGDARWNKMLRSAGVMRVLFSSMPVPGTGRRLGGSPRDQFYNLPWRAEYPGGREKCSEFRRLSRSLQKFVSKTSANSAQHGERIPYAGSQELFCAEQGKQFGPFCYRNREIGPQNRSAHPTHPISSKRIYIEDKTKSTAMHRIESCIRGRRLRDNHRGRCLDAPPEGSLRGPKGTLALYGDVSSSTSATIVFPRPERAPRKECDRRSAVRPIPPAPLTRPVPVGSYRRVRDGVTPLYRFKE